MLITVKKDRCFKTNKIDIVLMDPNAGYGRYEATIAIRNGEVGENATIPITVTADVMESTKSRTAEIGMNHYLSKPIKRSVICDSERASNCSAILQRRV
jgi:CheY-like chemotaxis protein